MQLVFSTLLIPGEQWQEVSSLPSYITPEEYEVQYNHSYSVTSETSPGEGWIQGESTTTYTKVGGEYESYYSVNETDTRRLVRYHYFHFCGPSAGDMANYVGTGNYVHYDGIDPSLVSISWQGSDGDDVNIPVYMLTWNSNGNQVYCQSGVTCDGAYGSHGARSKAWYRMNVYQDYTKSTTYEWTKANSGWVDTLDSTATSVRYRFRLKDHVDPQIESVKVIRVLPRGYEVFCSASDDTGIASVKFGAWRDSETDSEVVWRVIDAEGEAKTFEASTTFVIGEFDGERDCYYNTVIRVVDKAGNETEYPSTIRVYVPTLKHASQKLTLPAQLKVIEASAFEGATSVGEVIVPEGVEVIASRAFAACTELVLVQMPASVTEIAADAFADNSKVVLLCPEGSAAVRIAQENGWIYLTGE